jgi:hypothetical protein
MSVAGEAGLCFFTELQGFSEIGAPIPEPT